MKTCIRLVVLMLISLLGTRVVMADCLDEWASHPIRALNVIFGTVDNDALMQQLNKFAVANAFAVKSRSTRPDGRHIFVEMSREDVRIVVLNPFDVENFRVGFHVNCAKTPTAAAIDALVEEFRSAVGRVPGAKLSQTERP